MPDERVDTWVMPVVHRSFRRTFRAAPLWIRAVAAGDRDRAELVGRHLKLVVDGLHHHHSAEDDLLWPVLLPRVTLQAELVHRMESQHKQLHVSLERINELLPGWRATGDGVAGRELAAEFEVAAPLLNEHLAEEEAEILPLVSEHITQAEWDAMGEQAKSHTPRGRDGLVALGELLQDTNPRERALFLAEMPPPVRLLWRLVGKGLHQRVRGQLYAGVPQPHPNGYA